MRSTPTPEERKKWIVEITAGLTALDVLGMTKDSTFLEVTRDMEFLLSELSRREQEHQEEKDRMIDESDHLRAEMIKNALDHADKRHAEEIRKARDEGWNACVDKVASLDEFGDRTIEAFRKKWNPYRAPSTPTDQQESPNSTMHG